MPSAVTIGYYRFSDIWFEWHQVLPNSADIHPLKALLGYDVLVHPEHPLRKEGARGIELFMGTLPNGETRLMFSSAQVEYLRYWLHAMQLTETLIPIPYSEALLTTSALRNVSPVIYEDAGTLKRAMKTIEKNNKKLRYIDNVLVSRRHLFERVRAFWAEAAGIWCAVDFESWEREHTLITEFGWSLVRWDNGKEIPEQGHFIMKENMVYTNGQYVPDHRDNFLHGTSEILDKATFKSRIGDLLTEWRSQGPLFMVFHDANQDIKYLKSKAVEAPLGFVNYVLPDVIPDEGTYVVDTSDLFAALEGDSMGPRRGLEQTCHHLQISTDYMHNAGNDAHCTLLAMKSMASGDPVDMQREKRWPNHADSSMNGVKVQFQPWEENSDYSDSEGLMPARRLKLPGDDSATVDPAYDAEMLKEEDV